MNFHTLRDSFDSATTTLQNAESNLAAIQARSAAIANDHDAASQALAAARNARAANPAQGYLILLPQKFGPIYCGMR
jgi:hypothetical protein